MSSKDRQDSIKIEYENNTEGNPVIKGLKGIRRKSDRM